MQQSRIPIRISLACLLVVAACSAAPQGTTPSSIGSAAPSLGASPSVSPTTGPVVTTAPSLARDAGWQADIAALVPGMDRLHPDLFHGVSKADLDAAAAALAARVPAATDEELMVGVLGIVAMVSSPATCDGHTGAFIWGTGTYPVDSLPLRLWLFGDEVVVVAALPPYGDLYAARIDSIEGHPIADVFAAVAPIIPRDNLQTVRLLAPRFLLIPQVLRGLGLADAGAITLGITDTLGKAATVDIDPISMSAYNEWAGPYGLHLPADPAVPYLSRIDDALWWQVLDDGETLIIQNNRTDRLDSSLLMQARAALQAPAITRVILDLRHNFGGELSAIDPIRDLFVDPAVNRAGKLFVLIGRNTFSGGSLLVARLERDTQATFVGEATGGCPTVWADPESFVLPASGIEVGVSTDRSVGVDPADGRAILEPDVQAELSREEWAEGIDPALGVILPAAP
ncbi:MAG TPA: S41 family peptidase [Candidatus Limnocylindria bacterium]|nr:S41 family peptidase [Candidatus Limnocylindria bacterium]